jgi:hypothetical protein
LHAGVWQHQASLLVRRRYPPVIFTIVGHTLMKTDFYWKPLKTM